MALGQLPEALCKKACLGMASEQGEVRIQRQLEYGHEMETMQRSKRLSKTCMSKLHLAVGITLYAN